MADREIQHEKSGGKGRYFIKTDQGDAELTYRLSGKVMTIDHTGTPPALRGQGMAARLTEHAVAEAQGKERLIVPACPYVEAWFSKNPEWRGVLA